MKTSNLSDLQDRIEKALTIVENRQDNIGVLRHKELERYEALKRKHKQKMKAWKQQLDVLEDQSELLTSGNGAVARGREPRNLDQILQVLEEVLQTGLERSDGASPGRRGFGDRSEGRKRGGTNGHARHDDSEDEYTSLSEAALDEDGSEEDQERDEEDKTKPPQMVSRQAALRHMKPAGLAPPGFEPRDSDSPHAAVAPPGFESKAPLRSLPEHSLATNGFSKTSPLKESRGVADMKPTDLRSLLSRKREGLSSQLNRTPKTDLSDGDAPAPAVPDARELISMRKRDPPEPPAPRPMREWDTGKEGMQDGVPTERPQRPGRPGVPLYAARPRERPAEAGSPPPPPPGFSPEAEPPRPVRVNSASPQPVRMGPAPSGASNDGFKAPSSPMVDPEEGHRDRAYFGNGKAHSEDASSSTLHDQLFPSLGAAIQGADMDGTSSALPPPQLKGAWGSGSIASRLAQAQNDPATRSSPAPGSLDMIAYEQQAGLRPKDDTLSDKERRQQMQRQKDFVEDKGVRTGPAQQQNWTNVMEMRSKKDFVHEEDVKIGPAWQRGWKNVVEGLELHKNLLSPAEQEIFIRAIKDWEAEGRRNELRGRTFSAPRKSMRGKGRVTIQFGCCYNYAVDREGRQPGIIPEEVVEPMPELLVALVKRLVRWGVLPARMAPDSAIINIYDEIDCIPPHIDHHDFSRPFCTISLLSEQEIMFGHKLVPLSAGHFVGATCDSFMLPLPVGSCLVLKGNGADVAMHCVPPVTQRRMSITLRRMGPQYADQVRAQAERSVQRVQRLPRSWADDTVDETPKRYGADDWEETNRDTDNRLQRF